MPVGSGLLLLLLLAALLLCRDATGLLELPLVLLCAPALCRGAVGGAVLLLLLLAVVVSANVAVAKVLGMSFDAHFCCLGRCCRRRRCYCC